MIPAHPLALDQNRKLDECSQRALTRYYLASGVGGVAVGVHTTQFAIHDPKIGLYQPVLELAAEEVRRAQLEHCIQVAGIIGNTEQAVSEACFAREQGYHLGLLNLGAWRGVDESQILQHCRHVAEAIPLFGFYLQPAVGGLELSYSFWREFAEIEQLCAIKIAAFDRYQTLDVIRALVSAERLDVALYTGNDDNIVADLITPFRFDSKQNQPARFVGGLLGHWAIWTSTATPLLERCRASVDDPALLADLLQLNVEVTDCNAAVFDPAHGFVGCIPGILEVLRRQGLVATSNCLDADEVLSEGQADEITRVCQAYPHLTDDEFVLENLDSWRS